MRDASSDAVAVCSQQTPTITSVESASGRRVRSCHCGGALKELYVSSLLAQFIGDKIYHPRASTCVFIVNT